MTNPSQVGVGAATPAPTAPGTVSSAQQRSIPWWTSLCHDDHEVDATHCLRCALEREEDYRVERDTLHARLAEEERAHEVTIDQRDRAQEAADSLAYAIAPQSVIGEHTSENDPWQNALDIALRGDS